MKTCARYFNFYLENPVNPKHRLFQRTKSSLVIWFEERGGEASVLCVWIYLNVGIVLHLLWLVTPSSRARTLVSLVLVRRGIWFARRFSPARRSAAQRTSASCASSSRLCPNPLPCPTCSLKTNYTLVIPISIFKPHTFVLVFSLN